jgi:hypothetical protein
MATMDSTTEKAITAAAMEEDSVDTGEEKKRSLVDRREMHALFRKSSTFCEIFKKAGQYIISKCSVNNSAIKPFSIKPRDTDLYNF